MIYITMYLYMHLININVNEMGPFESRKEIAFSIILNWRQRYDSKCILIRTHAITWDMAIKYFVRLVFQCLLNKRKY